MTSGASYRETHPWLTFSLDLHHVPFTLWLLLGEARSKCEHLGHVPLSPDVAGAMHSIYLAKGIHATTAIEGNSLSEDEVRQRIEGRLDLPPSKAYLGQEIDNIVDAFNGLRDRVIEERQTVLTAELLLDLNRRVLRGLPLQEGVVPGTIRTHSVVVGRYRGAPAQDCGSLLQRLCDWLNADWSGGRADLHDAMAILKATLAHLYIAWIHPFGDGNGRTARLLETFLLLRAGMPTPACHLLSNHYNETRAAYYQALERTSAAFTRGPAESLVPFLTYAIQGFVDGLRGQLRFVYDRLMILTWAETVSSTILPDGQSASDAEQRLLHLATALGEASIREPGRAFSRAELTTLHPTLTRAYALRTPRTLDRDLRTLTDLHLIAREGKGWRPRLEHVLSLLPARHQGM